MAGAHDDSVGTRAEGKARDGFFEALVEAFHVGREAGGIGVLGAGIGDGDAEGKARRGARDCQAHMAAA